MLGYINLRPCVSKRGELGLYVREIDTNRESLIQDLCLAMSPVWGMGEQRGGSDNI